MFRFLQVINKKSNFTSLFKLSFKFSSNRVGLLGAPLKKGQPKDGVDRAPESFRKYGLVNQLQTLGVDIKDYGDLRFENDLDSASHGKVKSPLTVGAACQKISTAVQNVLLDGRKCVTIGGDHSIAIGTVHGHAQVHDVCVLWIDAHADINTITTTPSGNIHGMSCSFFINELCKFQNCSNGFEWTTPCVKKSNITYIGLRELDPQEKLILMKENILHFTMRDVDKLGIFEVLERSLAAINPMKDLSLHVSFDIDSIDKLITPSTGTAVMGGLSVREVLSMAEEISNLDCFRALDIVEVNPLLGNEQDVANTLEIGALVIKAFLGHSREGTLPKDIQQVPIG